eukprot:NODE_3184_length_1029_cov_29.911224_g2927_i0.p1 GENE.NODE_3184_length_1029_cov_29.911224_g2927_i0~~NODE_3184_length_1029_cov_29.911224_g2927_i0.p1  ORF type:complete len:209 (-),score=17.19 NODE_3184_length_1029_cov_29.911224_g2927_i0:316-942(-)
MPAAAMPSAPPATASSTTLTVPEDVSFLPRIMYVQPQWNPSCAAAAGLVLDRRNTALVQNVDKANWKMAIACEGYRRGVIYFAVRVVDQGLHSGIMIGVSDSRAYGSSPSNFYPGSQGDAGVSYSGHSGLRYHSNICSTFGPPYGRGDEIGVLLDLERRTCSFYRNGTRVGTAAGADILTEWEYFPAVAFFELGQTVISLDVPAQSHS